MQLVATSLASDANLITRGRRPAVQDGFKSQLHSGHWQGHFLCLTTRASDSVDANADMARLSSIRHAVLSCAHRQGLPRQSKCMLVSTNRHCIHNPDQKNVRFQPYSWYRLLPEGGHTSRKRTHTFPLQIVSHKL